ncbi:S-layer homology domain-containing protein [Myxosarcina sp. GI1]|uniref:S-layer homology domain-containing protein n=1 Tax=Myxosarcina sp. GI1 TaxID=1541065 RepID=UPI00055C3EB7|nr:S-layer homology domain-containing protein [Myxosarcina sp. GI1]
MTNLSPQPPENNEPQRRPVVTFDEMVGIIVAFTTVGAILFWSLGNKIGSKTFSQSNNNFLSLGEDRGEGERISTDTGFNRILTSEDSEPLQRSSKYLNRQSTTGTITSPSNESNRETIFARPQANNFRLDSRSRLTPTPLTLDSLIENPEVVESPQIGSPPVLTTPETETPDIETPDTPETPKTPIAESPEAETPDTAGTPKTVFKDVSQDYWAYPFVATLAEQGLITGSSENLFEPNKLITRASMATMVSMAFNRPENQASKSFTDITDQNAIATDINKTVGMGFMKGYSDSEFRPLENIPRYQVLVALATGLGLTPSQEPQAILQQFNDRDGIPDWATEQVAAATEAGLLVNRPDFANNALNPNQPATRAEVAAMIYQALVQTGKVEAIDSEHIVNPSNQ